MAAIIFDFDGTIADSFDYVVKFLAQEAGQNLSDEQKQQLHHMSMTAMAKNMGLSWWRLPLLGMRGRRRMEQSVRQLKPFKGMTELLEKLHAEGHELFIISTNSLRNLHNFLHHHNLHKYFLEVYGGVGYFSKTSALKTLFKEQNLDHKNCIYVGDEVRDIQAAQAAKTRVVGVTWGFAKPDNLRAKKPTAIADTPDDLLKFLETI